MKRISTINGYRLSNLSLGEDGQALQGQPDNRLYIVEDTRSSRWLRRWPMLGSKRVLKTINPDSSNRDLLKKSLEIEIQCLKELNHPGIIRYLDNFTLSDIPHLVVEKIPGKTLDQWVDDNGIDSETQILDWLTQLSDILDHIHSRSILHGDIKPKNIIINQKGELKLLDFGSAQRINPAYLLRISEPNKPPTDPWDEDGEESEDQNILSFTPGFSASEQKQGKLLPHSDFHMLGRTLEDLLSRSAGEKVRLNTKLQDLLNAMESNVVEERPASAEVIQQTLDDIAHQYYRKPRLYGWGEYAKRSLPISIGVTSVVIGLRFLGVFQPLELQFFDHTLWMRSELVSLMPYDARPQIYQADPNITIIAVHELERDSSLEVTRISDVEFQKNYHLKKRYPVMPDGISLSDEVLKDLVEKIQAYDPIAIGIDIENRDVSNIENKANLIGICSTGDWLNDNYKMLPTTGGFPKNIGFVDVDSDFSILQSGVGQEKPEDSHPPVRRQQILSGDAEHCPTFRSLAYQLLLHYAHSQNWSIQDEDFQPVVNEYRYPSLNRDGFFYARPFYPRDWGAIPHEILIDYRAYPIVSKNIISIQDILSSEDSGKYSAQDLSDLFEGRIILIGSFIREHGDFHKTPYGMLPGVILQAHKLSHLIDMVAGQRPSVHYWPRKQDTLWIVMWILIYSGLIYFVQHSRGVIFRFVIMSSTLYLICIVGIFHVWCFTFAPVIGGYALYSAILLKFPRASIKRWRFSHVSTH